MLAWILVAVVGAFRPSTMTTGRSGWRRPGLQTTATEDVTTDLPSRPRDVKFMSPLLEYGYRPAVQDFENGTLQEKPLLLYLPGFDGTFLSPFLQFPELHTIVDVRCLQIGTADRSTFAELKTTVLDYIRDELQEETSAVEQQQQLIFPFLNRQPNNKNHNATGGTTSTMSRPKKLSSRPMYLVGESFGGILAAEVALSLLEEGVTNLKGLTLINPATCYDRSRLAAEGPPVADLHPVLYPAGLLKLLPLFADEHSLDQLKLMLQAKALPSVIDNAEREAYLGRVALSLPWVLPVLTQPTLQWRLDEWLATGCTHMIGRLGDFRSHGNFRTLIVAGEKDAALPSIAEAERLASIIPNALLHVVEGAGHASTCGSRVDLAALLRQRFKELRAPRGLFQKPEDRTSMKPLAAKGKKEYFGMEPRYDNQTIGLSPLLYWNSKYYRKYKPPGGNSNTTNIQKQ